MSEISFKELKEMAKKVNALKLGSKNLLEAVGVKKLKTVGLKFEALAEAFLDAFEEIAGDEKAAKKVPKVLIKFQHNLLEQVEAGDEDEETEEEETEEEGEEETEEEEEDEEEDEEEEEDEDEDEEEEEDEEDEEEEEEEKTPKKKKKTSKKPTKEKKERKSSAEVDDYGFRVGSLRSSFAKEIAKKACKMADIREKDWNEKKAAFTRVFKKLEAKGLAKKTDSGEMYIVGSKAEPVAKKKKKK